MAFQGSSLLKCPSGRWVSSTYKIPSQHTQVVHLVLFFCCCWKYISTSPLGDISFWFYFPLVKGLAKTGDVLVSRRLMSLSFVDMTDTVLATSTAREKKKLHREFRLS